MPRRGLKRLGRWALLGSLGALACLGLGIVTGLFAPSPPEASPDAAYSIKRGELEVEGLRPLRYVVYQPGEPGFEGGVVFLSHGLFRDWGSMAGWADGWARRGFEVVVVDYMRWGSPGAIAAKNGDDLHALSAHLGYERAAYVGFSSGGLSSLLAAAADAQTKGVLVFDPSEIDGAAAKAGGEISAPIELFYSPPHLCNGEGVGVLSLSALPNISLTSFPEASHCWFEQPFSPWCALICGAGERASLQTTQTSLAEDTAELLSSWLGAQPKGGDGGGLDE